MRHRVSVRLNPVIAIALLAVVIISDAAVPPAVYWQAASDDLSADVQALVVAPSPPGTPGLPLTLYAGTFGDGIYRSTDHGDTWGAASTGITLPLHVQGALAVDVLNPTVIFAGDYYGFESGLYRSTDSGDNWSLVLPGASLRAVATSPITPELVLAGDRMAGLYRSPDLGDTWTLISVTAGLTDTHVNTIAFDPAPPHTAYVGAAESVFASGDGGRSWGFKSTLPSNVSALAVSSFTPATLFAGTYSSGVYTSTDAIQWMASNTGLPSGAWVTAIAFDPFTPTVVYAGTWEGQVYRSQDGGSTWTELGYLGNVFALAVHPTARGVIYAGTSNNGLFRGGTLDHLTMAPVDSPQYVHQSFPLTVTAHDALGFPLGGGFDATALLTDATGTISPTWTTFADGVITVDVVIATPVSSGTITATIPGGPMVTSNPFDVISGTGSEEIRLYLPLVLKR